MKKENTTNKKCLGCGAILQYDDPLKEGYIPETKYTTVSYCKRCFRLIHYNENNLKEVLLKEEDLINKINKDNSFTFFLLSSLEINQEQIDTYHKINNKMLILTKKDLLPKETNINKYLTNIKKIYDIKEDILLISLKDDSYRDIIKYIKDNTYVVGYTNAGKSSLLNKLKGDNIITTSYHKNTTLDIIPFNINNYVLYDTPGFNIKNSFDIKISNKRVVPISYQAKEEQVFIINKKIYITNIEGNVIFYLYKGISIEKKYNLVKEMKEIKINNNDLVINNMGFIKFKQKQNIKINPEVIKYIEIRKGALL